MKIAAFSDVTFDDVAPLANLLSNISPDLIVFAGDGLDVLYSLFFIDESLHVTPKKCLFVAGNNDTEREKENLKEIGAKNLHETPHEQEGIVFLGHEGAIFPSIKAKKKVFTNFKYTNKEAQNHLDATIQDDKRTVLISHTPPYGVLDFALNGGSYGAKAIKKTAELDNVILSIFGHVHFSGGNNIETKETPCINVASYEKQFPNCARVAVIDIAGRNVNTTWHSFPDHNDALFTINKISSACSLDEGLAALESARAWEKRRNPWRKTPDDIDQERINKAYELLDARWLVEELYPNKVDSNLSHKLWDYDGDTSFCDYVIKEFNPWPKYLGVASLLELYEKRAALSDLSNWKNTLKELPSLIRPHFQKHLRLRVATTYNKLVVDQSLFYRLRQPNLVFMDSEYAPNTSHYLTVGFKATSSSHEEGLFLWLDGPFNNKSKQQFFDQNIYSDDILIHYAGNESDLIGERRSIDLYTEIKKSIYYPFENRSLQTISAFLAKILKRTPSADPRYILKPHQKVLLSTANHIHKHSVDSIPFTILKRMCQADIELLHFVFRSILDLEARPDVVFYKKKNEGDEFFDCSGDTLNVLTEKHHD